MMTRAAELWLKKVPACLYATADSCKPAYGALSQLVLREDEYLAFTCLQREQSRVFREDSRGIPVGRSCQAPATHTPDPDLVSKYLASSSSKSIRTIFEYLQLCLVIAMKLGGILVHWARGGVVWVRFATLGIAGYTGNAYEKPTLSFTLLLQRMRNVCSC